MEVFKYLGCLIAFDDNHTQAVRGNLKKACGVWARISHVLRAENASDHVCGMFNKATVQSVLLFGSKTWCLLPVTLGWRAFNGKAARQITGLFPQKVGGTWKYPKTKAVLKAAGLHIIDNYVQVRMAHIISL